MATQCVGLVQNQCFCAHASTRSADARTHAVDLTRNHRVGAQRCAHLRTFCFSPNGTGYPCDRARRCTFCLGATQCVGVVRKFNFCVHMGTWSIAAHAHTVDLARSVHQIHNCAHICAHLIFTQTVQDIRHLCWRVLSFTSLALPWLYRCPAAQISFMFYLFYIIIILLHCLKT